MAVSGVTGGYLGSASGAKLSERLKQIDHKTGILRAELSAIAGAGADSALTGTHFDAAQVLGDNLGGAVGNAVSTGFAGAHNYTDYLNTLDELSIDGVMGDWQSNKGNFNYYLAEKINNRETDSVAKAESYPYSAMSEEGYSPLNYSSLPDMSVVPNDFYEKKEGRYDIDYDAFLAHKGSGYKDSQIVSYSYYRKSPGSPIAGDASRAQQIEAIDALIAVAKEKGLNLHDTAHVLAIARHESGFNRYAAAGTSSATGLGQFVKGTGGEYHITDSNRWDLFVQAEALVKHFEYNKALAAQYGLDHAYVYKFHHDGSYSQYRVETEGLRLSKTKIMPQIGNIINAIKKIY